VDSIGIILWLYLFVYLHFELHKITLFLGTLIPKVIDRFIFEFNLSLKIVAQEKLNFYEDYLGMIIYFFFAAF
jgi:hypothetical protein